MNRVRADCVPGNIVTLLREVQTNLYRFYRVSLKATVYEKIIQTDESRKDMEILV